MSDNNADFNGAGQVNNPTSDNAAQADYNQPYIPQQNDAQMNHPESQPETPAYDQNSAAYTQTAQSAQTAQPSYGQPATPAPAYGTAPVYTQPAQPATPAAPVYDPNAASYNQYGQYDQPSQPAQSAQPSYGQPAAPAYDPNNAYAQPDYNQANYGQQGYAAPFYNQSAYTQPAYAAPFYNQSPTPSPPTRSSRHTASPSHRPDTPRSRNLAAGLLGIFLGCFGVHNFYLGNTGKAVAQLLLTVIGWILIIGPAVAGIWGLVEGILILCSHYGSQWHRDAQGVELQD